MRRDWLLARTIRAEVRKRPLFKPSYHARIRHLLLDRLQVAFSRVRKNANSFRVDYFNRLATERSSAAGPGNSPPPSPKAIRSVYGSNRHELASLDDYTFVAFKRDPFARVLSAFLEKFSKPDYQDRYGRFALDRDGFKQFLR